MRMGGSGPKLDAVGGEDGRARRRGELDGQIPTPRRDAAQQPDHRRRRIGQEPVRAADRPHPVATADAITSSMPRTSRAAAVPTTSMTVSCEPDLVEMDLLGWATVQPALDLGQGRERVRERAGSPGRAGGPPRPGPRCGRGCAPRRRRSSRPRRGWRRCRPAARARPAGSSPRGAAGAACREHLVEVRSGIEQAAERHVAGDAREAVEPRHRRRCAGMARRHVAHHLAGSRQHPGHGARGAESVVDARPR